MNINRSLDEHLRALLYQQQKELDFVETGKVPLVRNGKDHAPSWIAEQKLWISRLQRVIENL